MKRLSAIFDYLSLPKVRTIYVLYARVKETHLEASCSSYAGKTSKSHAACNCLSIASFLQAACNKHCEFARLEELEGYNRVSCPRT